jgi:calcineurin-like phosphoesterase family protein
MSNTWLISDLHISHRNLAKLRGFDATDEGIAEHDGVLAMNWDARIGPKDHVWVLGDLCLGGKGLRADRRALEWIQERPGTKYLIAGNHDSIHPMHSKAHKYMRMYLEAFETVQQSAVLKIEGHRVWLSHFPFAGAGDHTYEERYTSWRFPYTPNQFLIHGHTHSSERRRGRMIHVGLDAWDLHPVPLNAVKLEMEVALAEEEAAQQALMKSVWEDITRYQVGEP